MSVKAITVFDSISAISVAGLTVKDINEVSETWQIRGATLYPLIDNLFSFNKYERMTFGSGTDKKINVSYTLNYRLLYAPLGSGRGIKDVFSGMMTMIMLTLDALNNLDNPSGAIDAVPSVAQGSPVVKDPAGNDFWGCDIAIDVMEYNEAV